MKFNGNKSTQLKKKAMIQAMEQSLGVVTQAAQKAGVGRKTYYEWLQDDPEFKKAIDDIENVVIDFAESKLYSQIKENNTTATIFYLKTKAKHRGYVEKQEIEHSGQIKEIKVTVNENVNTTD